MAWMSASVTQAARNPRRTRRQRPPLRRAGRHPVPRQHRHPPGGL